MVISRSVEFETAFAAGAFVRVRGRFWSRGECRFRTVRGVKSRETKYFCTLQALDLGVVEVFLWCWKKKFS